MPMCIVKSRSLCLLEKGKSRELMICRVDWRINKVWRDWIRSESIDRVIGCIIRGNHMQMIVERMSEPPNL